MESLLYKAKSMPYNSFEYLDEDDIKEAITFCHDKQCILLFDEKEDRLHLFWATDSCERLVMSVKDIMSKMPDKKLYLEFVPDTFVNALESIGFRIVSNFVDFWNYSLKQINRLHNEVIIREIKDGESKRVSDVTLSCKGISRGFNGESIEFIDEWRTTDNSCILVAEHERDIVGMCCLNLYGFHSEKGTVLWLREIAVAPKAQSKGIGSLLITASINWGVKNGAKRSFLACDANNDKAIKLYKKFGYKIDSQSGQINMQTN